jgi:hypothetical protein
MDQVRDDWVVGMIEERWMKIPRCPPLSKGVAAFRDTFRSLRASETYP